MQAVPAIVLIQLRTVRTALGVCLGQSLRLWVYLEPSEFDRALAGAPTSRMEKKMKRYLQIVVSDM